MASTLDFDDQAARQVEAIYSTPDVTATRIAVFRAADPCEGQNVLDIGCGPGYLLRDLAASVGVKGYAVGIDISDPMLGMARRRCADLGNVRLENAEAAKLPLADASTDVACATQVYAYVRDLDVALRELKRVLKPGGRALILDTDFSGVVWESRDRARMQRIMAAYDKHVAWPDLPRILPARLGAAGLAMQRCDAIPIVTTHYHPHTYIHGLARFIRRFVVEQAGIEARDADAWLAEFDQLSAAGAFFFSMNRYLFTAVRT